MAAPGSAGGLPAPAPGEDASPALALVNTRLLVAGQPADLVGDAASASGWLAERGLLPHGTAVGDAGVARLGALREAVRALFAARAEGRAPLPGDVSLLNAALAAAPLAPALAWDDGGPRRGEQPLGPAADPVGFALARLAGDALGLLTRPGHAAPARCGAHGCIRWYLRTHAARQWCSDRCGDRVRAARHYARRQAGSDDLPPRVPRRPPPVAALPSLCEPGALVLWTRHRGAPDLTTAIRSWFTEAGFREEAFDVSPDGFMSVGAHRLTGEPAPLIPGQRLFTFTART